MTVSELRKTVIEAINDIQKMSGRPELVITDDTIPLRDLPDFDSVNAEEVTVRILTPLDIDIATQEHLFSENCRQKSVGEIVVRLCELTGAEGE